MNLKHLQGLLKNVKKKDSISIFIDENRKGKFFIMIRPEGAKQGTRFETNSIVYKEEPDYKLDSPPDGGYKYPMVIDAVDFQKTKRLTTMGKIINVTMQRNNYLSFRCDTAVVYDSELGFGELLTTLEDSDDENSTPTQNSDTSRHTPAKRCYCDATSPEDCWCVCKKSNSPKGKGCGEYLSDCSCECEECGEYLSECTCASSVAHDGYDQIGTSTDDLPGIFKAQYYSNILTKLVKLPGLCTQMQFYAPTIPQYPLLIEVNAGQGGAILGTIRIFIKDVKQIEYEQTLQIESGAAVPVNVKSKKGKRASNK